MARLPAALPPHAVAGRARAATARPGGQQRWREDGEDRGATGMRADAAALVEREVVTLATISKIRTSTPERPGVPVPHLAPPYVG